jgi:glutaredoxin
MGTIRAGFAVALLVAVAAVGGFAAPGRPQVLFFYQEGCPDCVRMEEALGLALNETPGPEVARYELSAPGAQDLLARLSTAFEITSPGVPLFFVGDKAIVGAGMPEELQLRAEIQHCASVGCPSPLDRVSPPFPWLDLLTLAAILALAGFFLLLQSL